MPDPQLAHVLDFADHSAKATPDDIKKLCADVIKYGFHAAFVNPTYVTLAKETKALKMAAANNAVSQGADELDVVPNIGLYLAVNTNAFMTELQDIVESAHMTGAPVIVKFILDSGYFDKEADPKASLMRASEIVRAAGADFVKIGSGMGPRNPTLADLAAVKEAIGTSIKIKVAGGITDRKTAEAFFAAGANRIGTSHAIEIVSEKPATKKASKEE